MVEGFGPVLPRRWVGGWLVPALPRQSVGGWLARCSERERRRVAGRRLGMPCGVVGGGGSPPVMSGLVAGSVGARPCPASRRRPFRAAHAGRRLGLDSR